VTEISTEKGTVHHPGSVIDVLETGAIIKFITPKRQYSMYRVIQRSKPLSRIIIKSY